MNDALEARVRAATAELVDPSRYDSVSWIDAARVRWTRPPAVPANRVVTRSEVPSDEPLCLRPLGVYQRVLIVSFHSADQDRVELDWFSG